MSRLYPNHQERLRWASDMLERCPFVLVYGTLKWDYWNNRLLSSAAYCGEHVTKEKFALGNCGVPVAFPEDVLPQDVAAEWAYPVLGEVYEVEDVNTGMALDRLEGYPWMYQRRLVTTEAYPEAWMYVVEDIEQARGLEVATLDNGVWQWP